MEQDDWEMPCVLKFCCRKSFISVVDFIEMEGRMGVPGAWGGNVGS